MTEGMRGAERGWNEEEEFMRIRTHVREHKYTTHARSYVKITSVIIWRNQLVVRRHSIWKG